MADFPGVSMISGPEHLDPPTQLWISARLMTATTFAVAPFALGRRLPLRLVGLLYLAADAIIVLTIYTWDVFPVTLRETGLTQFKIGAEYVISALFVLAIWLLWRKRADAEGRPLLRRGTLKLLTAALVASIVAELSFTLYVGPHTWPNLVGHLFLGLSAILVYVGIVEDGLARPHEVAVAGMREARRLHDQLERGLLPELELRRGDVTVLGEYRPGTRHLTLGGDFLDVVDAGKDGIAVVCGDVSGHDPEAAALGAMLRVSWKALVLGGTPAAGLVPALHEVLSRERRNDERFATLCLGWIDPDRDELRLLTLGHPLPLLVAGSVRRLEATPAPPLGVAHPQGGEPALLKLPPDWDLLFYTDGLIEARVAPGSSERYGEERLIAALERPDRGSLDERCVAGVLESIEAAAGEPFADDVALVVISKRRPPAPGSPGEATVGDTEVAQAKRAAAPI
jgi:hypothetical protein